VFLYECVKQCAIESRWESCWERCNSSAIVKFYITGMICTVTGMAGFSPEVNDNFSYFHSKVNTFARARVTFLIFWPEKGSFTYGIGAYRTRSEVDRSYCLGTSTSTLISLSVYDGSLQTKLVILKGNLRCQTRYVLEFFKLEALPLLLLLACNCAFE
jgi:hypothetical protein